MALAVPGLAGAAAPSSSLLDKTVDKTVDSVLDAGKTANDAVPGVTDAVPDPVKEAVKPVAETVDRTTKPVVDAVSDAVAPVADDLEETVDGVREPTRNTVVPPEGATDPNPPRVPTTITDRKPASDAEDTERRGTADDSRRQRNRAAAAQTTTRRSRTARKSMSADTAGVRANAGDPSARPDTIGGVVADASRAFRFPLLLAAAVLFFLALQNRLDGRDPKLSAGRADEELTFA